jgi:hypothetical protein
MSKETARAKITGASRLFERACHAVHTHGDGTGTIVLDWYETSDGRDFMIFESFMRVEISAARDIVRILNAQLPGGLAARTEYEWPEDEKESED